MPRIPLYTNLVRYKQFLNSGELPPMMALSEPAAELIDPALTLGMGAIFEDEFDGLRCPLRGCGEFHHNLTQHLQRAHADKGGPQRLKALLSIPQSTPMISSMLRARMTHHGKALSVYASSRVNRKGRRNRTASSRQRAGTIRSVGWRNLRDQCEAQTSQKIMALANRIGRSPSAADAGAEYGWGFVSLVQSYWGTWNNAKLQMGLEMLKRNRWESADVIEALKCWVDIHGDLPNTTEVNAGNRVPLLPSREPIIRAFRASSWQDAMERAAALLGLTTGRYRLRKPA